MNVSDTIYRCYVPNHFILKILQFKLNLVDIISNVFFDAVFQ